jgi:hypothetical protein
VKNYCASSVQMVELIKKDYPMIEAYTGRMETPYVQNHQIPALRQGNRAPGSTALRQSFYDTTAYKQKEVWELIVFTIHPTVGVVVVPLP